MGHCTLQGHVEQPHGGQFKTGEGGWCYVCIHSTESREDYLGVSQSHTGNASQVWSDVRWCVAAAILRARSINPACNLVNIVAE